jgi:hypothetical protein
MKKAIAEKLAHLDHLNVQREALHQDLKRSLALQDLWPDAFDHGACTSYVVGNPRNEMTFVLTMGNGETREVPLQDVPVVLWSEQVRESIRKLGPHHARKYYHLLKGEST